MSRSRAGRPAMSDVARAAGVSHQTVSRVINSPDDVRPATRERVEAAIHTLGYRRNMSARALATRRTSLIGLLGTALDYYGPASIVGAVEEAARMANLATLVGIVRGTGTDEVQQVLESFVDRGVEGVVVVAPHDAAMMSASAASALVPTVVVADGQTPVAGCHVVSVDQAAGATMAVEHLIARGCTRIAHISGPLDWFDARARLAGWQAALRAGGLPESPVSVGDWSAERGFEIGRELAMDPPDAVFCGNDLTALGVLAAFDDAGVEVPGQVKVVGFDDIEGAAFFRPALTTVRQPFRDLGQACIDSMSLAIAGGRPAERRIDPVLIERASTRVMLPPVPESRLARQPDAR